MVGVTVVGNLQHKESLIMPDRCEKKSPLPENSQQRIRCLIVPAFVVFLLATSGCGQSDSAGNHQGSPWEGYEPYVAVDGGPTYHLLEGYDPKWMEQIKEGVELARAYWGSYGPTHVWILGSEDGSPISEESKKAFLKEYCNWRTASSSERSFSDCLPYAEKNFFDRVDRGDSESMLSGVRDTDPHMAELIFINVHKQFQEHDPISGPLQRGIHEYTHVYQLSIGVMPTWMMEGGALFIENWIPSLDGLGDIKFVMKHVMQNARRRTGNTGFSIEDMEEIEFASNEVAEYYLELVYYSGAWATIFIVHESPTQSVSALRDEFYPLVSEIGWEAALPRYLGMKTKAEFYEAFGDFMEMPLEEQLVYLDELKL